MGAGLTLAVVLVGCGEGTLEDRLAKYRGEVEARILGAASEGRVASPGAPRLPHRRVRRLPVQDLRMGPFDFLATIGCSLSEVVAQRNSGLGKVLRPTRRLAHELSVVEAMAECIPTLASARAERLAQTLETKRAELPRHRWNALWLEEEVERYLSFGPAAMIGGEDARDGARQLRRAAKALEIGDVESLEAALAQLRDDPPMGRVFLQADRVAEEFARVAGLVGTQDAARCGPDERKLAEIFRRHFIPLQKGLGELDRQGAEISRAVEAAYAATTPGLGVPMEMEVFRARVVGAGDERGVFDRVRDALRAHAAAWGPLLEECGVIPRA